MRHYDSMTYYKFLDDQFFNLRKTSIRGTDV